MPAPFELGPRELQVVSLLLQGCENAEIATRLGMSRRTVKAHFNRLFLRFGIFSGSKRVKLATLFYRRQLCQQAQAFMAPAPRVQRKNDVSALLPQA